MFLLQNCDLSFSPRSTMVIARDTTLDNGYGLL